MVVGIEAINTQDITKDIVSSTDTSGTFGLSREEVKKQRKLDEARKSGLIPAEKDEEGKDINPHIPQYIAKAPWYLNQGSQSSLKHQRHTQKEARSSLDLWYQRGLRELPHNIKYRPGACENCGAMTHPAKECTERPRKIGAKYTGQNIRPDELIVLDSSELKLDFDGKRDRYGGYNPKAYCSVIRDFELADAERKKRRAQELQEGIVGKSKKTKKKAALGSVGQAEDGEDDDDDDDDDDDEDDDVKVKDFDQTNAPIGMKDERTRTTTMNLRIREDTAKYLFNLDVNSAFYDPKTRSMRDNPLKHLKESEQGLYCGDNAMRQTGEAQAVKQLELFAWEAYKYDVNVHFQAQPTQLELMHEDFKKKQSNLMQSKKQKLLEKYGGSEHLEVPANLVYGQSEAYVEFNPLDGTVQCTQKKAFVKSKYNDDALFGDHTDVWGSWYDTANKAWGYACCKQLSRYNPECA